MLRLVLPWLCRLCALASSLEQDMISAVQRGNASEVQRLLDSGQVDVSSLVLDDGYRDSMLHVAARRNKLEVLRLLIEAWPEGLLAQNPWDMTPMAYAASSRHYDAIQLMLDRLSSEGLFVVLRAMVHMGDPNEYILERLLEGFPDKAKATDDHGWTLVHEAADANSIRYLELLLDYWSEGASATDSSGATPIHVAERSSPEALLLLLDRLPPDAPSDSLTGHLSCNFVIDTGCGGNLSHVEAWKDAAVQLQCDRVYELSVASLQRWLQCGGDIDWHDSAGTPLMNRIENAEARDYLQQRMTRMALVARTLQDWNSFVVPGTVALLASAVVFVEEKFMQRLSTKLMHEDATRCPFFEGAKLLVSQAFAKDSIRRRLWCWLEVCIAVLWLGFVLVVANWAWWLPVAVMSYLIPAIILHGIGAVLRAPALTVLSRGFAGRMWALLRTLAFCGLVGYVWGDFDNTLNNHWMFSWAPPLQAGSIFLILCGFYLLLVLLYTQCLIVQVCGTIFLGPPASFIDPEHTQAKTQAVKDLLQTQTPEEFGQVNTKIMPTVAFSWPWKGGGLYFGVALLVLDVVLDVNTIFTFLASKHYFFAAVMTFVVARSGLKQLRVLPPWHLRQAIKASTERGIMRQDLLDYLEEEKRSEAFFCACITAYAFFFAVQTADQMVVQFGSLLLSTFQFAGQAVC
ncbi:Ank2 [Symbiodinium sp. CCMP2592]|nr:Ank2 [Symbiodinium sp. CCMP2592]